VAGHLDECRPNAAVFVGLTTKATARYVASRVTDLIMEKRRREINLTDDPRTKTHTEIDRERERERERERSMQEKRRPLSKRVRMMDDIETTLAGRLVSMTSKTMSDGLDAPRLLNATNARRVMWHNVRGLVTRKDAVAAGRRPTVGVLVGRARANVYIG